MLARRIIFVAGLVLLATTPWPGRAAGKLEVNPTSISFPATCAGQSPAPVKLTVTNTDPNSVTVNGVTVSSVEFSVDSYVPANPNEQPGVTLEQNQQLTFLVHFQPTDAKSFGANLSITTQQPGDAPSPIPLSGRGLSRILDVNADRVSFGEQRLSTRSNERLVTIRNEGNDPLTIQQPRLSGSQAGDFRLSGVSGWDSQFSKDEQRSISISFQPRFQGTRNATLTVESNACTSPVKTVSLTGIGIAPKIRIDPTVLDLGQVPLNQPSERATLVVSNDGKAPLRVSQIQIVGIASTDFALEGLPSLPRTVAAGDSFFLNVIFTPSEAGTRRAGARITSDDPDRPLFEVTLSGVGGGASTPPSASPTASPSPTGTGTATSSPRALDQSGTSADYLSVIIVVLLVVGAFVALMLVRRSRSERI